MKSAFVKIYDHAEDSEHDKINLYEEAAEACVDDPYLFRQLHSSKVMYNLGVGPRFAYVSASARPQNNKLPWGSF